jgi:hypothetical protein
MQEIPSDPNAVIEDLLSERSLWTIYRTSRAIPFSKINNAVGGVFGLLAGIQTSIMKSEDALKQLSSLSTLVFNSTISLLGFLLAGFTFFATVADKRLFCQMAIEQHESGLSFLKYNLFLFMRVFVEFLVVCIFSLLLIVFLGDGAGIRVSVADLEKVGSVKSEPLIALIIVFVGLLVGAFAYLLMQLKSFIFNIHHVVMTSIAWEIRRLAEEKKASSDQDLDKQ